MSVVGIDFGYQTCFIAVARQGGIETVANDYSDRNTPACVLYGEKSRMMGMSAKGAIMSNIKNTIWGWKKLIGRPFNDPQVQKEKNFLPYQVVEGPCGQVGIKVQYLSEETTFTAEQVTATMFTKLKETASIGLKAKIVDCVISIPCYCTDTERRAMLDAAQMAGLNVLRLMNDTTAVALAYGIYKQDLPAVEEKPRNVIFVDMGHADLQLSACSFNKGKLKVLASTADPNLGGRDFDGVIVEHFAEEFKQRFKVDAKAKPRAMVRLFAECEKLKKLMSANSTEVPIDIECFMEDKDVSGRLDRTRFEEMAAPLLARIEQQMNAILDFANLKPADIYSVEVVGGSSRLPAFKNLVKTVFGLEANTTLNADEAVARGCALQCAILSPTFRVRDFSIQDAQPYPITLSWQGGIDEDSNDMEVFSRFHQIPFSKMLTFYRREPFTLHAKYNLRDIPYTVDTLGSFLIDKIAPSATGDSSKIKVKVRVNIHGIFTISNASLVEKIENEEEESMEVDQPAEKENEKKEDNKMEENKKNEENNEEEAEKKEDEESKEAKKKVKVKMIDLPIICQVPELSKEDLNLMIEKEAQMIMQDKLEKEKSDARNAVEEYVYEMRDKLGAQLQKFVLPQDRDSFMALLEATENWLYEDGEDCNKQVYLDKLAEMKKLGQPIVARFNEWTDRPKAFEELGKALQQYRKALDSYANGEDKYAHIEQAEVDKVIKCVGEKSKWWEVNLNACSKLQPHENAPVTPSLIRTQRESMISTCTPIMNKPKPKPKEEPPKEEKKEENLNDYFMLAEKEKTEEKKTENEAEVKAEEKGDPNMDLD
ncbi:hypothetical protein CAPTEDRAFT_221226 [Capitella teleta]|uniref:Uncharacterized protein n=1 Tax=Capitella teleta TaxID=283909 RepID=R7TM86_CAPTE|nr:hypothetical protein CAPTEDRAFT_221226 [Capitella teleta]|eukprot:ELT92200.1 hypothetical protein CAPTEDRAFT_221226 [Capitella teleta]